MWCSRRAWTLKEARDINYTLSLFYAHCRLMSTRNFHIWAASKWSHGYAIVQVQRDINSPHSWRREQKGNWDCSAMGSHAVSNEPDYYWDSMLNSYRNNVMRRAKSDNSSSTDYSSLLLGVYCYCTILQLDTWYFKPHFQ